MNILVISLPDLMKIPPQRPHYFLNHLSKKHNITVISVNAWWLNEIEESKTLLKGINYTYITNKKIHPIIQEFLILKQISTIKREKFDLIINFDTLSAAILVKMFIPEIPLLFDIADELVSGVLNSPKLPRILKNKLSERILHLLLSFNFSHSEIITIISGELKRKYNLPNAKILPNGVRINVTKFSRDTSHKKKKTSVTFGFVGVVREWVDLNPIFYAISKIKSKYQINLVIIGDGPLISYYTKLAQKLNIEKNVEFVGFVPHSEVPLYLQNIDIGLIPFNNSEIAKYAFPIKLLEYFSLKRSVISSRLPTVETNFGGLVFYAEKEEEYIRIIEDIMKNKKTLKRRGALGYQIVKNKYIWENIGKKLELIISKISQEVK